MVQTPYLQFIHELTSAFRTRPIVLLEGRHVSVCLSRQSLCSDDMATAVRDILRQHGWAQAAFIGHSYGTFVLSRIAQIHKPIIQSMVRSPPLIYTGSAAVPCMSTLVTSRSESSAGLHRYISP